MQVIRSKYLRLYLKDGSYVGLLRMTGSDLKETRLKMLFSLKTTSKTVNSDNDDFMKDCSKVQKIITVYTGLIIKDPKILWWTTKSRGRADVKFTKYLRLTWVS